MIWRIWKRMLWSLVAFVLMCISFELAMGEGEFAEGMAALFLAVLLPLFLFLFFWGLFTSIKLTRRYKKGEDISYAFHNRFQNLVDERKQLKEEVSAMTKEGKRHFYTYRLLGAAIALFGLFLIVSCGIKDSTFGITVGTIVLIAGLVVRQFSSSTSYNNSNGLVKMISSPEPVDMERLYEALKDLETPWGSPYLARMAMVKHPVLVLGPNDDGEYVYANLNGKGTSLYVSASFIPDYIKEQLAPRLHEGKLPEEESLETWICFSATALFLKEQFYQTLKTYLSEGVVEPISSLVPGTAYSFDESFKLSGQRFSLSSVSGEKVFDIEGTYPLKTFTIRNTEGEEVFSASKEVLNLLATYRFTANGEFYGTFTKEVDLTQDTFTMDTPKGKLLMEEIGATVGKNYLVSVGGKTVGYILDNLNLTLRNMVFDNSVLFVKEKEDLPLMTALAIMAVREEQRDRNQH